MGAYGLYRLFSGIWMPLSKAFVAMFDVTAPAETWVIEMLNGLHSCQSTSLMPRTAALLEEYTPFQGVGLLGYDQSGVV